MHQVDQLICEIRELYSQYQNEVPSNRKAWPASIRERVSQLRSLKVSCKSISDLTGIPVPTLYLWNKKTKAEDKKDVIGFIPVPVASSKAVVVPETTTVRASEKPVTVTVVTPKGFRLEGLDLDSALTVIGRLEV